MRLFHSPAASSAILVSCCVSPPPHLSASSLSVHRRHTLWPIKLALSLFQMISTRHCSASAFSPHSFPLCLRLSSSRALQSALHYCVRDILRTNAVLLHTLLSFNLYWPPSLQLSEEQKGRKEDDAKCGESCMWCDDDVGCSEVIKRQQRVGNMK